MVNDSTTQVKSFAESKTVRTVFTTHRKAPKSSIDICRKGSIVKERCKQLIAIINDMFPSQVLSDEDLTCLIEDYIGADKETLRSYKGYGGHVRTGRCGDNHIVGISRKGYLEKFGFLRKIGGRRWAVCQAVIFSQACMKGDSGLVANEKISISVNSHVEALIPKGMGSEGKPILEVPPSKELEEEATEKERNFTPMISPMIEDNDPNLAYLKLLAEASKKQEEKGEA
ncbi:MAG: hypothetical protein ABR909_08530 [Candidatus Bathyarchaeia archaeon]|jgi:hypothetical protein